MSATRYAYMGGCDGTSNVLGGMLCGIKPSGTHAHSLVSAYTDISELRTRMLIKADGSKEIDIVELALKYKKELHFDVSSMGELAAFISFAQAFPNRFLALVDTYDTLQSGVPNYICVALALYDCGYKALGIRLDSGDLAYLSREARNMFIDVDKKYKLDNYLKSSNIVASNDINEEVLNSLRDQPHEINTYGIGTNLVTCQGTPALGMVYKLVEINGAPRIKLSQEVKKVTIPGSKEVYRLIGNTGIPILDLIIRSGETRPAAGSTLLCRHPFDEQKRAYVTPAKVLPLLRLVWKGAKANNDDVPKDCPKDINIRYNFPTLLKLKEFVTYQLQLLREDHLRPLNATPYKVSVSPELYHYIHDLWMRDTPIPHLE